MLVPLLAAALAGSARADTALADTARAAADSARCATLAAPSSPVVRIVADDSAAATAFAALGAELRMEGGEPRRGQPPRAVPAELRVTKRADALTPLLAARLASGRRLASVVVEIPGAGGPGARDTLRVRLADVAVVTGRLVFPVPPADADAQRLAQELAVEQAAADRAEAARQLAEAEALAEVEARDRRKLVPANALARARDQLRLLDLRLATARRQLALAAERVARASAPTEELVLRAERAEVMAPER